MTISSRAPHFAWHEVDEPLGSFDVSRHGVIFPISIDDTAAGSLPTRISALAAKIAALPTGCRWGIRIDYLGATMYRDGLAYQTAASYVPYLVNILKHGTAGGLEEGSPFSDDSLAYEIAACEDIKAGIGTPEIILTNNEDAPLFHMTGFVDELFDTFEAGGDGLYLTDLLNGLTRAALNNPFGSTPNKIETCKFLRRERGIVFDRMIYILDAVFPGVRRIQSVNTPWDEIGDPFGRPVDYNGFPSVSGDDRFERNAQCYQTSGQQQDGLVEWIKPFSAALNNIDMVRRNAIRVPTIWPQGAEDKEALSIFLRHWSRSLPSLSTRELLVFDNQPMDSDTVTYLETMFDELDEVSHSEVTTEVDAFALSVTTNGYTSYASDVLPNSGGTSMFMDIVADPDLGCLAWWRDNTAGGRLLGTTDLIVEGTISNDESGAIRDGSSKQCVILDASGKRIRIPASVMRAMAQANEGTVILSDVRTGRTAIPSDYEIMGGRNAGGTNGWLLNLNATKTAYVRNADAVSVYQYGPTGGNSNCARAQHTVTKAQYFESGNVVTVDAGPSFMIGFSWTGRTVTILYNWVEIESGTGDTDSTGKPVVTGVGSTDIADFTIGAYTDGGNGAGTGSTAFPCNIKVAHIGVFNKKLTADQLWSLGRAFNGGGNAIVASDGEVVKRMKRLANTGLLTHIAMPDSNGIRGYPDNATPDIGMPLFFERFIRKINGGPGLTFIASSANYPDGNNDVFYGGVRFAPYSTSGTVLTDSDTGVNAGAILQWNVDINARPDANDQNGFLIGPRFKASAPPTSAYGIILHPEDNSYYFDPDDVIECAIEAASSSTPVDFQCNWVGDSGDIVVGQEVTLPAGSWTTYRLSLEGPIPNPTNDENTRFSIVTATDLYHTRMIGLRAKNKSNGHGVIFLWCYGGQGVFTIADAMYDLANGVSATIIDEAAEYVVNFIASLNGKDLADIGVAIWIPQTGNDSGSSTTGENGYTLSGGEGAINLTQTGVGTASGRRGHKSTIVAVMDVLKAAFVAAGVPADNVFFVTFPCFPRWRGAVANSIQASRLELEYRTSYREIAAERDDTLAIDPTDVISYQDFLTLTIPVIPDVLETSFGGYSEAKTSGVYNGTIDPSHWSFAGPYNMGDLIGDEARAFGLKTTIGGVEYGMSRIPRRLGLPISVRRRR